MPTVIVSKNTTGAYANTGYTGVTDTRMRGLSPTTNYASGTFVATNCWDVSSDDCGNTLFKFDVSSIGAGTVTNAEIGFWLTSGNNDFRGVSLYQLLVDFIDTQATFLLRKTGTNWNTNNARGAGTDRASTAVATASRPDTSGVWMTFTGSALNALIEDFLDGTATNNGFTMEITDYADDLFTFQDYASSEGTDGQRPYLKFDHTPSGGGGTTYNQAVSGSVTLTHNAYTKKVIKQALGQITTSGFVNKKTTLGTPFVGSITPSASIFNGVSLSYLATGSISLAGGVAKGIRKGVSGSVTATGNVIKKTGKLLVGSITTVGTITRKITKFFSGSTTGTATITTATRVSKSLSGSTTPSGTNNTTLYPYVPPPEGVFNSSLTFLRRFIGRR